MSLATLAVAGAVAPVLIADINEATLGTVTDELTAAGHRTSMFVVTSPTRTGRIEAN